MKQKVAVFTIVQNEPAFLPIWSTYYRSHVSSRDIFVLDHGSTDPTTLDVARSLNRVPVHRAESFNHAWLRDVVERFQAFLLESYERVLFTEVDEIVAADPMRWPDGLRAFLTQKPLPRRGFIRCTGYEIVHQRHRGEPKIDWERPLLQQRGFCRRSRRYSKPLLASRPLAWDLGFHALRHPRVRMPRPDPELLLLHLHRLDYDTCRAKKLENASRRWSSLDAAQGRGYQNRIVEAEPFDRWFYTDFYDTKWRLFFRDATELEPIPSSWRGIV